MHACKIENGMDTSFHLHSKLFILIVCVGQTWGFHLCIRFGADSQLKAYTGMISIYKQYSVCSALCLEVGRRSLIFLAMAALVASNLIVPASTAVSGSQSATKCSCGPLSSMMHIKQSQRGLSMNFVGLKNYGSTASSLSCYGNIHDIGELRASSCNSTADKPKRFSAGQARAAAFKVAVLGAAGGIGQPLGLLLKMSPLASSLHLYDIANVNGVAADLSHCNTPAQVVGFTGPEELGECLKGVDLVVIPAGVPRKPGMTRDDLFNINAGIVKNLVEAVAEHAPGAWINIISNPVNSTVPIAAEILKQKGVYNPKKLFGVTTLDVVRSNTFVAEKKNLRLIDVDVPVVGGHAGVTILPLLSKTRPTVEFTAEEVEQLTIRIQDAGTEVVKAKAGAGSATLSMAYAAARFAESCIRAMDGDTDVYECAYIQSELTELPYFASRVKLGKDGIEGVVAADLSNLTDYEKKALEALKPDLKASIEKGINFVKQKSAPAPAAV